MPESKKKLRVLMVIVLVLTGVAAVQLTSHWWRTSTPPARTLTDEADGAEPSTEEYKHTNHLIGETSPYLLQHAHNPVNWYPWGKEALEKAKAEGKPIFLSVGYSTCYWCHVMEKESFEDEKVAKVLNEHFVCIKVDREERPDIDEQYMLATQLVTGRGGWPNSVWLTPDGRPWMAGTYFPKPQFLRVLDALIGFWSNRRPEVEQQADQLAAAIRQIGAGGGVEFADAQPVDRQLVGGAVAQIKERFDPVNGGFGGRPKFPPHGSLGILIHEYRRTGDKTLEPMITRTLDAMWLGGMHDHVGGGFHRYATDSVWLLPHFEKMLYDNAQLMRAYTDGYLMTGAPRYRAAVEDIFSWVQREMTSSHGAFYSAIDSGEVGKEGETYVWHYKEVIEVLGAEDGKLFAEVYNIQERGNFREEATGEAPGTNILHLKRPLDEIANERGRDVAQFRDRVASMRSKLLERRDTWAQPHKDDKVLTSWNGLMIAGLAYAGRQLDEPRYTNVAARAAEFILSTVIDGEGRLLRTYRAEQAKLPGYLDDYAYLAEGLLELHRATKSQRWLDEARRLADVMLAEFEDKQAGGFYFSAVSHEGLLTRSKNLTGGGNVPSANGVAAIVMTELAIHTGEQKYAQAAERTLSALAGMMRQRPSSLDTEVLAAAVWLNRDAGQSPSPVVADQPVPSTSPTTDRDASGPREADAAKELGAVTARLYASRLAARPGQTFHLAVELDIVEGWHLYGPNPDADFLIPTAVTVKGDDHLSTGDVMTPKPLRKLDPVLKRELDVYEGRIRFYVPVMIPSDATAGAKELQVVVKTQACDATRCLPPRTDTLSIPIAIDPDADVGGKPRHAELFVERERSNR